MDPDGSSDVREIVSLQSFINDMETELHSVGVEMEECEEDEFDNKAATGSSSAQAKANVAAFIEQMEQELGIVHGDYSNILSPVAFSLSSPVKGGAASASASATTTPARVTPRKMSQSHLHFVQRIESKLREEEEREEAMTDVCVTTKYGELREYLSSPAVVRDASSSSSTRDSDNNGRDTSPSSSEYSLHVNSEAKAGVDALFDSLKVKNLDLHYGSPDVRRHLLDQVVTEGGDASGADGSVGAGLKLNHSIKRSLEFNSPTRVSTGVGSPGVKGRKMEGVTEGVDASVGTTHKRDNSNANTIYGKITPDTVKMLGDERINNDYDDWHSGPNMEPEGIQRNYSGLYGTLATTTGNYAIVHGIEIVLRPDVSLMTHILPALQRAAEASKLSCEVCQSSHVLLEQRSSGLSRTDELLGVDGRQGPAVHNMEWDCIDIQVCVSRALKHRVLLCQFFKKLSPFVAPPNPNDSAGAGAGAGGADSGYALKPHTFQFLKILRRMFTLSALSLSCLYSLPLELLGGGTGVVAPQAAGGSPGAGASVATKKTVEESLEVLSMVSESGEVYDVPYLAAARPDGAAETPQKASITAGASAAAQHAALDYHYVSQLEGMFREDMWKYLREAGKVLEESYKQSESDCATLLTALQPIYKQHDVPLPAPPPRVKLADIPMPSNFKEEEAETEAASTGTTPSKGNDPNVPPESMTVIAQLLKELWSTQKKRCDVEIKARLTQKNRHLVNAAYSFTKYKGLLISTLASGPGRAKAAKSSLNSAFVAAYMFTKVTNCPKNPSAAPSPTKTTGATIAPVPVTPTRRSTSATLGSWLNSAAAYVAPLPPPPSNAAGSTGSESDADGNPSIKPMFSLAAPPIVMFWCNCLVTTTPGTLYITVDHIYIQYGFLHVTKEAYPLSTIDNCQEDTSANVPTLKISLGDRKHQLSITPIGVECSVLKTVLYDVLNYSTHGVKSVK